MEKKLPEHLTKGGPGDKFLGGGSVDTSSWFNDPKIEITELEKQIKDEKIWFCTAPFQQLYTDVQGNYGPCSWAQQEQFNTNIRDVSMKEWFENNPKLNQLREEMLTPGSDLKLAKKSCIACVKQEKNYGRSRRQSSLKIQSNNWEFWNEQREAVNRYKKTKTGHIKDRIFEVQIKAFGNQCNLDCFMCHTYDSSMRTQTMNSEELKDQTAFSKYGIENGNKTKVNQIKGAPLQSVIDQIKDIAPYIWNVKLIGGEPLVMKQYYKLLDAMIETGYSKRMQVKFQTNMSVMGHGKYKITDYTKHFRKFELTVSLDSIGKADEYIRRRSNWEQIVNNIKEIKKYPNVSINVNGTISFLSVLRFYELIEWFDNNSELFDQINWSNIRGPAKLCANVLPDEIKKELIPKYANFPDIQNVLKEDNNGLSYLDTIDYLLALDKY